MKPALSFYPASMESFSSFPELTQIAELKGSCLQDLAPHKLGNQP